MLSADWWLTLDGDEYCRELYERHYSARKYRDGRKPKLFCGPGFKIVLRTWGGDACWVWKAFDDASGQVGICNGFFHNESRSRSSDLIRQACDIIDRVWPDCRQYTYINERKVKSNVAGYCYRVAKTKPRWKSDGYTKGGLKVLARAAIANAQPQGD